MARPATKKKIMQDNIKQIEEYKSLGVTDEQICSVLNIGKSTWSKLKNEDPELLEVIKRGSNKFIITARGELARQAIKHTLETKKQYQKVDMETGHKTQYTEITTKEVDGNIGALHLLLKNLDRDNWKDNWDNFAFKQMELELRKKEVDNKLF